MNKETFNLWGKYFFTVDWKRRVVEIDNKMVPFDSTVLLENNVVRLVMNHDYNPNVIGKNYYVQFAPPSGAAGSIIPSLGVSPLSFSSTVLNLNLETPVPEKGRDVLNKLFEIYNLDAIGDKNQIAEKTLRFIDDRLELVTAQLDSVEKNIAGYKSRESVVDLSAQASAYLSKVTDLDKQNSEIELKMDVLNELDAYVRNKGKKPGTVPSLLLLSDPTLSGLLDKLYMAETQAASLTKCYRRKE